MFNERKGIHRDNEKNSSRSYLHSAVTYHCICKLLW